MGRADAADSKAVKTTRRKKVARVKALIANRCAASATDLQERLDLRTREFREALEQQAATANVLRVISDFLTLSALGDGGQQTLIIGGSIKSPDRKRCAI